MWNNQICYDDDDDYYCYWWIESKQTGGVGAVTPAELKSIIPDLSTILLTVSMPLKQTDHYFIKTFLRIVLFMNTEVCKSTNLLVLSFEIEIDNDYDDDDDDDDDDNYDDFASQAFSNNFNRFCPLLKTSWSN